MIVTIEEAKTKWCPKYQVAESPETILTNRAEYNFSTMNCKCIADGCMAWREVTHEECNGTYYPCNDKGYCGFAGKPEGGK